MNIKGLDYNTQREKLVLPEYGREVQNMADYAVGLKTKAERLRCAYTIVATMERMFPQVRESADYKQKLWDHLVTSPRRCLIRCRVFPCATMVRWSLNSLIS